jgi:hypothetical protein
METARNLGTVRGNHHLFLLLHSTCKATRSSITHSRNDAAARTFLLHTAFVLPVVRTKCRPTNKVSSYEPSVVFSLIQAKDDDLLVGDTLEEDTLFAKAANEMDADVGW